MSDPSHQALSRIHASWQAHRERCAQERAAEQPDRNIALRASRSLPPLTKPQQAD